MKAALGAVLALAVAGCIPSTRTPERLYSVVHEMETIKSMETSLVARYLDPTLSPQMAKATRNEIIAQRMYAIDVQYTQYESALTREVQEVGFAALTSAEGLTTASTLVANVATKSILSAVATAVLASRGHYNSEVLLAQTIRTIQKQMRASRNIVATAISAKLSQDTADYPLAAALSDVEDYYNAGTLTTGVIDTSTTVGIKEDETKRLKQEVALAPAALRAEVLGTAVVSDATVPLPATPAVRLLNPEGQTGFERTGLTPAIIRKLERVVCPEPLSGRLTANLRDRVLTYLNKKNAAGINAIDAQRLVDKYDTSDPKPTCPKS